MDGTDVGIREYAHIINGILIKILQQSNDGKPDCGYLFLKTSDAHYSSQNIMLKHVAGE